MGPKKPVKWNLALTGRRRLSLVCIVLGVAGVVRRAVNKFSPRGAMIARYDNLYPPRMVETTENTYNIQLKLKITYLNLTRAQLNYTVYSLCSL